VLQRRIAYSSASLASQKSAPRATPEARAVCAKTTPKPYPAPLPPSQPQRSCRAQRCLISDLRRKSPPPYSWMDTFVLAVLTEGVDDTSVK
jgi:hypothetical protein